ncbi:MAG: DUF1127 domain-containing protein [SAR324 cluster bacterium]|nr:DUF1127 domain-containing protein [SAR324 cluster bacterium]
MKPENLIKIASYHSLYGESNLFTIQFTAQVEKKHSELKEYFNRLLEIVWNWNERQKQRTALLGFNDYYLKDIGLTRFDVEREADKWFWQD